MAWLIAGLFVLLLTGGLIGFARAREHDREHDRQPTDDTLVAELLGEDVSHAPDDTDVLPAARPPEDTLVLPTPDEPAGPGSPASTAPAETGAPARAPGTAAEDGDWLESQLAWIRNWSQRMQEQLGPGAGQEHDRRM
jgi:hypothetical protein